MEGDELAGDAADWLLRELGGKHRSQVLSTLAAVGVADVLQERGACSAADLAAQAGCEPGAPESLLRAYHARSAADENVVVSFGLFDGTVDELRSAIGETDEAGRQERMAEHIESTSVDGLFEVLDEVTPGG